MLPGFRFLFAATLLTVSLLVFGLGAAALLRASHERFASLPVRPAPAPVFMQTADAAPPTLSMLRVEPAPVETRPEPQIAPAGDTLLSTDTIATLSATPRVDEPVPPPPDLAVRKQDVAVEIKPEPPEVEAKPEPQIDIKDFKVEPTPQPPIQVVTPLAPPAETVAAAPAKPTVIGKSDAPATPETTASASEPVPQIIAALPEPEATGSTPAPVVEPPLVNAKPIKRPPVPVDRPAKADRIAALPDPAVAPSTLEKPRPAARKPRPVVKRVVKPARRVVARPAPQRGPASVAPFAPNPASPFGASPFGT